MDSSSEQNQSPGEELTSQQAPNLGSDLMTRIMPGNNLQEEGHLQCLIPERLERSLDIELSPWPQLQQQGSQSDMTLLFGEASRFPEDQTKYKPSKDMPIPWYMSKPRVIQVQGSSLQVPDLSDGWPKLPSFGSGPIDLSDNKFVKPDDPGTYFDAGNESDAGDDAGEPSVAKDLLDLFQLTWTPNAAFWTGDTLVAHKRLQELVRKEYKKGEV